MVESSVNHSPTSSKTLRVKLTVAPDGSQSKKSIVLNHPGEGWQAMLAMGLVHSQLSGRLRAHIGGVRGVGGGEPRAFPVSCSVDKWSLSRSLKDQGLDTEGVLEMEGPG